MRPLDSPEFFPNSAVQQVSYPSSYDALPRLSVPDPSEIARAEDIKRSLVRKAGIRPGTYSKISPGLYPLIEDVFNGLMGTLLSELAGVDSFDLCIRLYKRNEEYLGRIFGSHFARAVRQSVSGFTESPMPTQQLWERMSRYTESIRWLIEIAVKRCETPGERVTARKFDRLVELARAVFEWDMIWEHIHRNVIPHEITFGSDLTVTAQTTPRADKILQSYRMALKPNIAEHEREEYARFQEDNKTTSVKDTIETMASIGLDPALKLEQGYSMSDWIKFCFGLTDSFEADEYCKVIKLTSLGSFLSQKWSLASDLLPYLLKDFGLSKETVGNMDIRHLRPAECGRRDSRLLRRPVVVINRGVSTQCIYGAETTFKGSLMTLRRLETGRIDLVRYSKNKDLRRAVSKLQVEVGKVFERDIAEHCKSMGYQCQLEKQRIKGTRIPQGKNFGPVDVFVVDRANKRFVLIEAKNVMDEGVNPKEMEEEIRNFAGYISKLNSQVAWFTQHLNQLKIEYGIAAEETYSIEGVIVVNNPRVWMFAYEDAVPILDYVNFFNRLAEGSKFVINPIVSS